MRSYRSMLLAAVVLAVAGAAPAAAQTEGNLQVHGYLSQAFGIADGGQYLGVPEAGTTDYRTMALQFGYTFSPKDNVVLQLSHRRMGESPMTVGEQDVRLDWAFYARQMGAMNLRVGRIPIPFGIYNEMRDVGVTLPLYRAPYNFYLEGSYTSETVDGAVARIDLMRGHAWNGELSAYAGSWSTVDRMTDFQNNAYFPAQVLMRDGLGGQFWLNTPVDGVRFGVGAMRSRAEGGQYPGTWKDWHVSADVALSRFTARAEYRNLNIPGASVGAETVTYAAYYGYLGLNVTDHLTLHGQADFANVDLNPNRAHIDYDRTYATGASWRFRSNLVLKGEVHFTDGYWADAPVVLDPTAQPSSKVTYGLLSISTSF